MKLLKIFDVCSRMSALRRFSQIHLVKQENVLEHTGFVVLFSYFLASYLKECGEEINLEKVLCKAVVHDIDEIITGDIPRPTKYYNDRISIEIRRIELENIIKISNAVNCNKIITDWTFSKTKKEGAVVEIADLIAVIYKVWQEYDHFNNSFIIENTQPLKSSCEKIKIIGQENFIKYRQLDEFISEVEDLINKFYGGEQNGD